MVIALKRLGVLIFGVALNFQTVSAAEIVTEELAVPVNDQELSVLRYPAKGKHLIIWIAPSYDSHERAFSISRTLAGHGVEVWHVDLADSLFMTKNTSTMRSLDGRYVARLIEVAHEKTGKQISLLSRSYGSLPLLRGARLWQIEHEKDKADYLSGAILFSPELYSTVPALGLDPVYSPIASATNIPIMLYQAGKRSNRWQLDSLLDNLQKSGSQVFVKIKSGVVGMFYQADKSDATKAILKSIPRELVTDLTFLKNIKTPKSARPLSRIKTKPGHGLDSTLIAFKGNPEPIPLRLITSDGLRFNKENYKGKVTVVNFWATWCPPCVEEIPSLNNLKESMKGRPFELISVNYAESRKVVLDFMKLVNVDFPVLLDEDGRTSAKWNVLVFPSTFVIGPDGKIKYGVNGAIHWDSPEIIDALNNLLPK